MVAMMSSPEHPVINVGTEATNSVVAEVANHPERGAEPTLRHTDSCTVPRYRLIVRGT
jgi:hypothetical protein